MSYREKAAWIALLATGLVYGGYFWKVMPVLAAGPGTRLHYGYLLFSTILAVVILQVIPLVGFAIASPTEAKAPADEREKLFALRATRAAYYVLVAGALFVSVEGMFMDASPALLANLSLLAVVTASLAQHLTEIGCYRFSR